METGRWWHGKPEQIQGYIEPVRNTLLLGITKLNRKSQGITTTGLKRPAKFKQSVRSLYYNLGDEKHVLAFLKTFQHMTAMAAGIASGASRYHMDYGECRTLAKSRMELLSEDVKSDKAPGYEVLELLCENGNKRRRHTQTYAQDPEVRDEYLEKWRRRSTKRKRYTFRIRRIQTEDGGEFRASSLNECSEMIIPYEAVHRFAESLDNLIRYVWSYTNRHQSQLERQLWEQREQLHKLDAYDRILMPRIVDALGFHTEWALFSKPALYRQPQRLRNGVDAPESVQDFNPFYLRQLSAFEEGDLQWKAHWNVHEMQALDDLITVRRMMAAEVLKRTILPFFSALLVASICRCRKPASVTWSFLHFCRPVELEILSRTIVTRARGPP